MVECKQRFSSIIKFNLLTKQNEMKADEPDLISPPIIDSIKINCLSVPIVSENEFCRILLSDAVIHMSTAGQCLRLNFSGVGWTIPKDNRVMVERREKDFSKNFRAKNKQFYV